MTTQASDADDLVTRRLKSSSTSPVDDNQSAGNSATGAAGDTGASSVKAGSTAGHAAGAAATGSDGSSEPSGKPSVLSDDEWAAIMADDAPATEQRSGKPDEAPRPVDVPRRGHGNTAEASGFLPTLGRVWIAVSVPVVLIALAMRVVITPAFAWFEYKIRPGFPADPFGFSDGDRIHWASYVSSYLLNFDGPSFLSGLRYHGGGDEALEAGKPVFKPAEIAHMQDVKTVILIYFVVASALLIGAIIFGFYLTRRTRRGLRMSLFSGSIALLALVIGIGIFAALSWDTFFTDFHSVFFASGSWTFYTNDTLIRLYPSAFWTDAGIFIGGATVIGGILMLVFNWPKKRRGQRAAS